MTESDILNIKTLLSTPKKIVVVPHKNPDGDALGATLALYHYLKKYHHEATVIAPNEYPEFLKWLPGNETVVVYDNEKEESVALIKTADIIFTLDFNALDRAGDMAGDLAESSAIKIMIDHHQQPDDYATYMYSDVTISSTCEMVFNVLEKLGDMALIDKTIATCLYTGILTDTGSFRFPATTSTTHRVAAFLIDAGAVHWQIHNSIFDTNSYNRMQLLGKALSNLNVLTDFKTAYITLSQEELNAFSFKKGDTEGFVNYALSLKNIVFAVIFIEDQANAMVKISFRSKGTFSVNEFARAYFNGGGHTNAAGGRSELPLTDTVEKFIAILPQYSKALNHA